jgi:uncharacterized protein YsxB (DUF464 family)
MVKIRYNESGNNRNLRVIGHATSPQTEDGAIICSACSMVTYTIAQNVYDMASAGLVSINNIRLESGNAEIDFNVKHGHEATVDIVINAIFRGYELLANQYEKIFSITYQGWGEINFPL